MELAERLVSLTGIDGGKVALFNAGAEAIENAVKFAKAATGRHAVICFEGGVPRPHAAHHVAHIAHPSVQARVRSVRP